jgi:polar amino acid transport system permease protein/polar amino acid transport system substrate-binding protein
MRIQAIHSVLLVAIVFLTSPLAADGLDAARARGCLVWGGDQEGGGPYVYPDPADPHRVVGFEVTLAELLGRELGVKARFQQGNWDNLPALLAKGDIDIILNGYELTEAREAIMDRTDPYYIYELVLLGPRASPWLHSFEDLKKGPAGRKPRLGVLGGSSSHGYLEDHWKDSVEIVSYDGNTNCCREVETGKLDATLQDLPIAVFYRDRFPELKPVGEPVGRGHYVMYLKKGEKRLRDALNEALRRLLASGELKKLYESYGIWTPAQEGLGSSAAFPSGEVATTAQTNHSRALHGWNVIRSRGPILLESAGMTVFLAVASMPLAIVIGLLVALGRLYGPARLRWLLTLYVEVLRGTPLMLQLFLIYYMLPEIGVNVPALLSAVLGLAINYSAYESEIYRAGLLAIPAGQMEAALALGMTRGMALRRIIVPQAVRLVIPPVTNDFIALFKDTSVCSVITVMELTKRYSVEQNDTGATLELAALTALLYMLMSFPLSKLASYLERRQGGRVA